MGAGRRFSVLSALTAVGVASATGFAANAHAAESWTIQQAELLSGRGSAWTFTEATADGGAVWAAGVEDENVDQARPSVARWNGSGWTEIAAPPALDGFAYVTGFSAPRSDNLWLVLDAGYSSQKRVYHYDGSTWTRVTSTGSGAKKDQVSASASRAWTIASDHDVARHLGGSWTRTEVTPTGELEAVDARSRSDVWAVGNSVEGEGEDDEPPSSAPLAVHWNGTRWAKTSVPAKDCELADVTAVAADDAWATCVSHDRETSTVVRWDGTAWSKVGAVVPAAATKITATSDGHAWASAGPAVWHYDGSAWTSAEVPRPTGEQERYDHPQVLDVTVVPGTHSVVAAGHSVHHPEDPMGLPDPRIDMVWRNG